MKELDPKEIEEINDKFVKRMKESSTKSLEEWEQMRGCVVPVYELSDMSYNSNWMKELKEEIKNIPISICNVESGYGTGWYDHETGDGDYEYYADIKRIILNEDYWEQYDDIMSTKLWSDFELDTSFDEYKLIVYSDDRREAIKL